jgi:hypothetical protein
MKKYISAILIPCLLLQFVGCYSSKYIAVEQLVNEGRKDAELNEFQDSVSIGGHTKYFYINTINEEQYFFSSGNYFFDNDSLNGIGRKILGYEEEDFSGKIALVDISTIEQKEINTASTLWFIFGSTLIIIGMVVGAVAVGSQDFGF